MTTNITAVKLRDREWIRQTFLVGSTDANGKKSSGLDDIDVRNRAFSTAKLKFTDTTPGGNIAINPPPQFTRTADIKAKSIIPAGKGMGRYYSEAIDDNSRLISMRFGMPTFNSLTTFWAGFYDSDLGALARTGKRRGAAFTVGQAIGYVVPLLSPVLFASGVVKKVFDYLTISPTTRYYYMNPAMPLYHTAVNTIFNNIAVNKGVVPRVFSDETRKKLDGTYNFTADDYAHMQKLIPDIMTDSGGINTYAITTKAQRNQRALQKVIDNLVKNQEQGGNIDIAKLLDDVQKNGVKLEQNENTNNNSYKDYILRWLNSAPDGGSEQLARPDTGSQYNLDKTDATGFMEFLNASLDDGSQFVSFRVDADGTMNESFSNSVGQPEIAGKFNSKSSESRTTMFNLAGGNIGDGMLLKTAQAAIGGVRDLIEGVGDGLGISGIAALAGAAFVDIPNVWTGSTGSLPRMNYSMTLNTPYGNKLSQLLDIYLPLSMILAAALPLSTGRHSYTSPFLVELYDRGRAQTRLGIIDSLNITRGTGSLAFDNSGNAMSIEVSFSVVDLSSIVHVPVARGFSFGQAAAAAANAGLNAATSDAPQAVKNAASAVGAAFGVVGGALTDDSAFSDYMAILGGLSLHEQVYTGDRLKLALTKQFQNFDAWSSKANLANWTADSTLGRLASAFYTGVINR